MKIQKNLSINNCNIKMDDNGGFAGYASVFGGVDSYGDTIVRGAYESTLQEHGLPKMFFNHNGFDLPIGKWSDAGEDETGLFVKGELTEGHSKAADVYASMKHGTIDGLSVGFYMTKGSYEETDTGRTINNIDHLVEVSIVTEPADKSARIDLNTVKYSLESIETLKDYERHLRDAFGMSKAAATAYTSRLVSIIKQSDSDKDQNEKELKALYEVLAKLPVPKTLL